MALVRCAHCKVSCPAHVCLSCKQIAASTAKIVPRTPSKFVDSFFHNLANALSPQRHHPPEVKALKGVGVRAEIFSSLIPVFFSDRSLTFSISGTLQKLYRGRPKKYSFFFAQLRSIILRRDRAPNARESNGIKIRDTVILGSTTN